MHRRQDGRNDRQAFTRKAWCGLLTLFCLLPIIGISPNHPVKQAFAGDERLKQIFQIIDEDGNGEISLVEFRTHKVEIFSLHDSNNDRHLLPDETIISKEQFAVTDANGDGKLSPLEWVVSPHTKFEGIDGNSDGLITFNEFDAALSPLLRN